VSLPGSLRSRLPSDPPRRRRLWLLLLPAQPWGPCGVRRPADGGRHRRCGPALGARLRRGPGRWVAGARETDRCGPPTPPRSRL